MDTTGEIIPMEKYIANHGLSAIAATLATTATITSIPALPPLSLNGVPPSIDSLSAMLVIPPQSPPATNSDDRVLHKKCVHHNNMARCNVRMHPYFQQTQSQLPQQQQHHQQQSNIEVIGVGAGTTTTLRLVPSAGNPKSTKINVSQTVSDGNKIIFHSYARANSKVGDVNGNTSCISSINSNNSSTKNCNGLLAKRFLILDFYDGNSVHKCFDVKSKTEYVCKVILNFFIK